MPSGYQPLAQSIDEESDVGDSSLQTGRSGRGLRRAQRPGPIDLSKLDNAFKRCVLVNIILITAYLREYRWTESIAQRVKRKKTVLDNSRKQIVQSVFDPPVIISTNPVVGPVR